MKNKKIKEIVLSALGIACVFLATYLIKVPNGIQGYFNLGDGFILLFGSLVNPLYAFIIGGVGSGLADVVGGYGIYFIPTLLIKGTEAILVSLLVNSRTSDVKRYAVYVICGFIMIAGYFVTDAYVNQSWQLSLTGIPSNIIQAAAGIVIAGLIYPMIKHQELK